ncbi:hypothetical protein A3709_13220 [Halioglobus sp. HI00S01]|uniref:midcut-by-XrtH protein n=1 Tax=Halioglobus sp. HI00S01 TaxID=1822214 RepID=UPI0007C370E7|nr:midcut-by-XrtH protein [Halioglobus sp. HI00S01]KZX60246.1 hypothetical protein A3709_13220 [Halioglobus sp. HI00S01]
MSTKHAWAAISSLTLSSVAFAQTSGTLTYGPAPVTAAPTPVDSVAPAVPVPIPSLLLIPLGVVLALIGYRALRSSQGRKLLSVMLLGVGLTLSALGSLNIPQALASMLALDNPEGGVIDLPVGLVEISNTSGVALKLGSLSIDPSCTSQAPSTTQCENDLILESDKSCSVDYDCKKVVFVTSTGQSGNLGGLGGADGICTDLAASAGLQNPGNYKAWLSDSVMDVATRFASSEYEYRLVDGTVIASGFSDIIDGQLSAPISLTEDGTQLLSEGSAFSWTGTNPLGYTVDAAKVCLNWTSNDSSSTSFVGANTISNPLWTAFSSPTACNLPYRLYCFEQ